MKEERKIEDYLHLYLGCDVRIIFNGNDIGVTEKLRYKLLEFDWFKYKPILRRLDSMTEEERREFSDVTFNDPAQQIGNGTFAIGVNPFRVKYLLSKSFDLFGLIDSGLAIDSSTIQKT